MFKKKKSERLTEQELQIKAQQLLQKKIQKADKEIRTILEKYDLDLITVPMIQIVPKQR